MWKKIPSHTMLLLPVLLYCLSINLVFSEKYKILALCPFNSHSHFTMCESLMKGLAKKGHRVDVVSQFPQKNHLENYRDLSLRESSPTLINNVTYDRISQWSGIYSAKLILNHGGNPTCELLGHPVFQSLIQKSNDDSYNLLVVQVSWMPCYLAFGRYLNIPMIGLSTTNLLDWMKEPFGNSMNPSFVSSSFLGYSQKMNFMQRLFNRMATTFQTSAFEYYSNIQNEYVKKYFGPGFPSVMELHKDVSLVLVNSHYSLDGIRPMSQSIIEVGGIHIMEDNEEKLPLVTQKWLDESENGFIYVSFGSMVKVESFPKKMLNIFYTTFKAIAPIRVLLKISEKDIIPSGLPDNVKVFSWLPQIQVLKHKNIRAFVTQGGMMSTVESIKFGVPIIGIPFLGEQVLNVNHCVQQGFAILLSHDSLTLKSFKNAVNDILRNTTYRMNAQRLQKLYWDRLAKPLETAIFWVEYIGRHGNILRSPVLDLKWWQIKLLDVYAFLLLTSSVILYVIYLVIKNSLRFCSFWKEKKLKSVKLNKKNKYIPSNKKIA